MPTTNAEKIAEFKAIIDTLSVASYQFEAQKAALNAEYDSAMKSAACAAFPSGVSSRAAARYRFLRQFTPRAKTLVDEYNKAKKEMLDRALELALQIEFTDEMRSPDLPPTLWRSVYSGAYLSQGFGADAYAKGSAEMALMEARAHGFTGDVSKDDRSGDWVVYLRATPLALAILNRKPSMPMREWVRLCWKSGLNPRVFNPFLPAGYEERVGLDYFGNETRKQEDAPSAN